MKFYITATLHDKTFNFVLIARSIDEAMRDFAWFNRGRNFEAATPPMSISSVSSKPSRGTNYAELSL